MGGSFYWKGLALRFRTVAFLAGIVFAQSTWAVQTGLAQTERWTEKRASDWYAKQPWLVGANYIPSDAINQMEMFQARTFNPSLNDKELGLAESAGMNVIRVFLQDQLWLSDPNGMQTRIDQFLAIASRHHIRVLLVLFDSCWEPNPHLGPQHPPIPGVHNSGWVQSPGKERLIDRRVEPELKQYVQQVVAAFGKDDRVLGWDVWNEPNNRGRDTAEDTPAKVRRVNQLLPFVFEWAREMRPTQPLTSGVWGGGDWGDREKENQTVRIQLAQSDIITFHNYDWQEIFAARVKTLEQNHRPIICTEYMARGKGSLFDTILPLAKSEHVGLMNWGLVAGKTQTYLPWDSWTIPYVDREPVVWFHDVFKSDWTPYRQAEIDLLRKETGRGTE